MYTDTHIYITFILLSVLFFTFLSFFWTSGLAQTLPVRHTFHLSPHLSPVAADCSLLSGCLLVPPPNRRTWPFFSVIQRTRSRKVGPIVDSLFCAAHPRKRAGFRECTRRSTLCLEPYSSRGLEHLPDFYLKLSLLSQTLAGSLCGVAKWNKINSAHQKPDRVSQILSPFYFSKLQVRICLFFQSTRHWWTSTKQELLAILCKYLSYLWKPC
jgi:hypothetical protein